MKYRSRKAVEERPSKARGGDGATGVKEGSARPPEIMWPDGNFPAVTTTIICFSEPTNGTASGRVRRFRSVPFGDIAAGSKPSGRRRVAVLVEPIRARTAS